MVAQRSDTSSRCFMFLHGGTSFCPSPYNGLSAPRFHEVINIFHSFASVCIRWVKSENENEAVYDGKEREWVRGRERAHETNFSLSSCFKVTPSVSTKMYFWKSVKRRKENVFRENEKLLCASVKEKKLLGILVIARGSLTLCECSYWLL